MPSVGVCTCTHRVLHTFVPEVAWSSPGPATRPLCILGRWPCDLVLPQTPTRTRSTQKPPAPTHPRLPPPSPGSGSFSHPAALSGGRPFETSGLVASHGPSHLLAALLTPPACRPGLCPRQGAGMPRHQGNLPRGHGPRQAALPPAVRPRGTGREADVSSWGWLLPDAGTAVPPASGGQSPRPAGAPPGLPVALEVFGR